MFLDVTLALFYRIRIPKFRANNSVESFPILN